MKLKRTIKLGVSFAVARLVEAMEGVEIRAARQQSVMADLVNERDWLLKRVAVLEKKLAASEAKDAMRMASYSPRYGRSEVL